MSDAIRSHRYEDQAGAAGRNREIGPHFRRDDSFGLQLHVDADGRPFGRPARDGEQPDRRECPRGNANRDYGRPQEPAVTGAGGWRGFGGARQELRHVGAFGQHDLECVRLSLGGVIPLEAGA
jgi:hypothetical protein